MNTSNVIAVVVGGFALLLQYIIFRVTSERQRYEGRILMLLEQVVILDLKKGQKLSPAVIDWLQQRSRICHPHEPRFKHTIPNDIKPILQVIYSLEIKKSWLDKCSLMLLVGLTVSIFLLIYLVLNN